MLVGFMTIIFASALFLYFLTDKFDNWRRKGCRIKALCKPHIYRLIDYNWNKDGYEELVWKCRKCGKIKRIFVDTEDFNNFFNYKI